MKYTKLGKRPGETSRRLREDSCAKGKYDAVSGPGSAIIARVAELADKHGVSMTESPTALYSLGHCGRARLYALQRDPQVLFERVNNPRRVLALAAGQTLT